MYFVLSLLLWITACAPSPEPASGSTGAADTDSLYITEWDVPFAQSRPRDPYVGPDGRVWFVGQRTHYVASFDPSKGEFKKYDLEPGTGPHTVIVGDDGIVWIAGNQRAYIGRMDPETGEIEKIPMPDPKATDPHTMAFDSHGDIWFTMQSSNRVGKLDIDSREIIILEVPTASARPYGLVVDDLDRPWIVLFGTNKLATVDPATMVLREIELPRQGAHPRRLGITSDGGVWYVDYEGGFLGRYDPADGNFQEWPMPGGERARPYAMAIDDKDRIWFVETGPQPNRFVGFDPNSAEFFSVTNIPSGAQSVRHMYFDAKTGSIWFGTDYNTIGHADVSTAELLSRVVYEHFQAAILSG